MSFKINIEKAPNINIDNPYRYRLKTNFFIFAFLLLACKAQILSYIKFNGSVATIAKTVKEVIVNVYFVANITGIAALAIIMLPLESKNEPIFTITIFNEFFLRDK